MIAALAPSRPPRQARPPIQARLRVGSATDPLEHEADRVADAVMAGAPAGALTTAAMPAPQRKCAACKAEEEPAVQRKCATCGGTHGSAEAAAGALSSGGRPLPTALRRYFEPRFGRSLGDVRVHDHAAARSAADGIGAHAYTWGRDIGFAAGAYRPHAPDGRCLIAHEIAHTIQQAPFIARQAAVPFYRRTFAERGGGGTTDFEETVQVQPAPQGTSIVGSVDRRVLAPAAGGQPQQAVHTGRVNNIRFDPDCKVVVPYRIQFLQSPTAGSNTSCQSPPSATAVPALPAAQVTAIANQYLAAMNSGLNGRFSLVVEGCNQPCTGKPIPIVIDARSAATGADRVVNIVPRGGRADAGTICANNFQPSLAVHEGGHQALGAPDEYQERSPQVLAAMPQWGRPERVRTDLSYMNNQDGYGRFVQFHERHFRFAQAFLEAVFQGQGCKVSLKNEQPIRPDFRLDLSLGGGVPLGGGPGFLSTGLFVGLGVPLERERRFMFEIGAQGRALISTDSTVRNALMAGVRLGIEARSNPGDGAGVSAQLFGSAGGLYRPALSGLGTSLPARGGGYGEAGFGIGVHDGIGRSGGNLHLRLEAAIGSEAARDEGALRWVRAGLALGGSF
ncbi:eCIS core domain-containing protein [Sphingomonas quercus]|uniref:DUF4157 domain-containing protein n=1 Tax=Sphingomonas quercus TaxID=2842451 RepID=A0ABS6BL14_9SPHN|nr:DUF4157 domain-containing protein [Sphingomonas quercus]MBU3078998.1 DUF4157 domain-containing protein [Sphingomonas quercus]